MDGWRMLAAAAVGVVDVFLKTYRLSGLDGTRWWTAGLCSASTHCSPASTIINKQRTKQEGEQGALRYLLRAPLAFVEDVPQDKHYFGPEQPQSGLESSLHLPFPVRLDTTSKRYVLFLFTDQSRRARSCRRMERGTVMDCLKMEHDTTSSACRTSVPRRLRGGGCPTAP